MELTFTLSGTDNLDRTNVDNINWYDPDDGGIDKDHIITFVCGHKMYAGDIHTSQKNQLDEEAKSNKIGSDIILKCQCGCVIFRSTYMTLNIGRIQWYCSLYDDQEDRENP